MVDIIFRERGDLDPPEGAFMPKPTVEFPYRKEDIDLYEEVPGWPGWWRAKANVRG